MKCFTRDKSDKSTFEEAQEKKEILFIDSIF